MSMHCHSNRLANPTLNFIRLANLENKNPVVFFLGILILLFNNLRVRCPVKRQLLTADKNKMYFGLSNSILSLTHSLLNTKFY